MIWVVNVVWKDAENSYGWVSILLHWVTGLAIVVLLYTGDAIQGLTNYQEARELRSVHVSVALSIYLLLVARIVWRLLKGHPNISGQNHVSRYLAKLTHYLIFVSLLVMLVSGPVVIMSYTGSHEAYLFGGIKVVLASFDCLQPLSSLARALHGYFSKLLLILLLLHIGAAFKHMMFNDDETFIRIFIPRKNTPFNKNKSAFDEKGYENKE